MKQNSDIYMYIYNFEKRYICTGQIKLISKLFRRQKKKFERLTIAEVIQVEMKSQKSFYQNDNTLCIKVIHETINGNYYMSAIAYEH